MAYASVYYPKSDRPYTFFTQDETIQKGQKVVVKDRNGFSFCDFVGYVKKPKFSCQVIVISQSALVELVEEIEHYRDYEKDSRLYSETENNKGEDWPEDREKGEEDLDPDWPEIDKPEPAGPDAYDGMEA